MAERASPEELFDEALALPPDQRSGYLDARCGGNPALRAELDSMLSFAEHNPRLLLEPTSRLPLEAAPLATALGPYHVVRECGRGGMGIVYEALDTRLGRRVALKVLPEALARDPEALARFEREARVLATFSHEGIATLHSLEDAGGYRFFTMEFVEGQTLAELLRKGALPPKQTLEIGACVVRALEYAHSRGIVHRDLKPANIMVRPDGSVKILDFGIAKALVLETRKELSVRGAESSPKGTPGYMSPEQASGEAIDFRTDLWALGCVFFECLTGTPTFPATRWNLSRSEELGSTPDLRVERKGVPPAFKALLRSCLQVDPSRRPASTRDVRRTIERMLRGVRRNRVTTLSVLGALITVSAIGILILRSPSPEVVIVDLVGRSVVQGLDRNGREIWRQQFGQVLADNYPNPQRGPTPLTILTEGEFLIGAAVMAAPDDAPASLLLLDPADGHILWSREAAWQAPLSAQGPLQYQWTQSIKWPGEGNVLAVGVIDGRWYSGGVQFITSGNRLLATYYHPGNVHCSGVFDLDGDGREALLLRGDNSSARFLRDLVPFETRSHCGFVLLLEPPNVFGQAFPYSRGIPTNRDWPGIEEARERAYLLIPPVTPDAEGSVIGLEITKDAQGEYVLEAETADRRFFRLDQELRPQSCYVAVGGAAEPALSGHATSVPVVHIQRGQESLIDVPLSF